ncbi:MAG TPA: NAD(P)H-hydrate dehydratase [Planctomycetaceae bacterium]|nr:NAD(P)H-hydrate dehydratase [Planctomycetaceae bacterium]HRE99225.1 NAD(P)H-hydrate dehydratase [Pirellulaceae bacterium]
MNDSLPIDVLTSPPVLPKRRVDAHKGDCGRVLLIGGSRGMSGAIALAGRAALRGGAGLVTLAVPDRIVEVVASLHPAYMTLPLACDTDGAIDGEPGERLIEALKRADAVAVGPGLGRTSGTAKLLRRLAVDFPGPLVIDADALFPGNLADLLERRVGERPILTPHAGEFSRLMPEVTADRGHAERCAVRFAAERRCVVVLKGAGTFVSDGVTAYRNPTGNPGMATGGTGDVLTGLIVALTAQGMTPLDASMLGTWLHGRAGDLAAADGHPLSLIATDLIERLPAAFRDRERLADGD